MFVNQGKLLTVFLAIFVALALTPIPRLAAQASGPQIVATQPVYAIWRIGGMVDFTASRLTINTTYYVWYARPGERATKYNGTSFKGTGVTIPFQLSVAPADPPGTYLVSLSTSKGSDTRAAIAHFGVLGTDANNYKRTANMQVVGGGFKPNSTIAITLTSTGQALANLSAKVDIKGDFNNTYKLPPSFPLGQVAVSVAGPAYDTGGPVSARASAIVGTTSVSITPLTQPPATLERTTNATFSVKIVYSDGSPVTTSTQNSTRVFLVTDAAGGTGTELSMVNTGPTTGTWTAVWAPSYSQNLGSFHFTIFPTDFDDTYGNTGQGKAVVSSTFQLTVAQTGFLVHGNSTVQRTLPVNVAIVPTYHDGKPFANVTQAVATLTDAHGTKHQIAFNRTLDEFVGDYETNASTPLGSLTVSATVADIFGNTATGSVTLQIIQAVLRFTVDTPTAQRTTILNVTTRVTYPNGSVITPAELPSGFNVTLSKGNFTWSNAMGFDQSTHNWSTGYRLSQNATLGDYAVAMNVTDPYGNGGAYSGTVSVVPATFIFELPRSMLRVSPNTRVYVVVNVIYPNGSALIPSVGHVVAEFTNSSGTFTLPLDFNATDRTWLFNVTAPDPGFRFGLTLTFSFIADDQFGNTGAVLKAFELDITAGTETLILATILGSLPPIGLIGWAITTVTARRRKHKP
ncbi:MAG TPA: hypothetical protein VEG61_03215 [Candidatus Dormibacteraeota bacterium]|nr:hypothetical protein [Candidatus Dormibacteraeota bacterium]